MFTKLTFIEKWKFEKFQTSVVSGFNWKLKIRLITWYYLTEFMISPRSCVCCCWLWFKARAGRVSLDGCKNTGVLSTKATPEWKTAPSRGKFPVGLCSERPFSVVATMRSDGGNPGTTTGGWRTTEIFGKVPSDEFELRIAERLAIARALKCWTDSACNLTEFMEINFRRNQIN